MTYHDKIFLLLSSGFVLSPSFPFSSEPQWAGALLKLPGRMVLHYQTQRLIVSLLFSSITSPLSGILNKNDSNTSTHNDPLLTSIQSSADSTTHQTRTRTHTLALIDSGPEHTAKVFHNTVSARESRIELVGEKKAGGNDWENKRKWTNEGERESEMKEKQMEWVCIQKNDRRSRPEKGGMKEGRKEISP